jgi:hypothetical protein
VPKQLSFDPRSLQGHCLVERIDMGSLQPNVTPGIVKKCTSSKLKACYLLAPVWGFDARHPSEKPISEAWNKMLGALAPGAPLYTAGTRDVVVSAGAITHGSPKLQLFQLQR